MMAEGGVGAFGKLVTDTAASILGVTVIVDGPTCDCLDLKTLVQPAELLPDCHGLWRASLADDCLDSALLVYIPTASPSLELLLQEIYRVSRTGADVGVLVLSEEPEAREKARRKLCLMGDVQKPEVGENPCLVRLKLWRKPRIIAMMRVKNEQQWIETVLGRADQLVAGFVILDDGSTDATPDICEAHPKTVELIRQQGLPLDEVRDKNLLLHKALDCDPDWVICLDGDEVIEDCGQMALRREIRTCPDDVTVLGLSFPFMWDSESHYRDDRHFNDQHHKRVFRARGRCVNRKQMSFKPTTYGGNFHCGSVPRNITGRRRYIDMNLKHYGYYELEQRQRKRAWYEVHDPENAAKGYYDYLTDTTGMLLHAWRERGIDEVIFSDASLADYPSLLYANRQEYWKLGYFLPAGLRSCLNLGGPRLLDSLGLDGKSAGMAPGEFVDYLSTLDEAAFDVVAAKFDDTVRADELDRFVWQAQRVAERLIIIHAPDMAMSEDFRRNRFVRIPAYKLSGPNGKGLVGLRYLHTFDRSRLTEEYGPIHNTLTSVGHMLRSPMLARAASPMIHFLKSLKHRNST